MYAWNGRRITRGLARSRKDFRTAYIWGNPDSLRDWGHARTA
jgi:hypothetical protein